MTPTDYGLSYLPYFSGNYGLIRPYGNARVKIPTITVYYNWDVYLNYTLLCSLKLNDDNGLHQPHIWNNIKLYKVLPSVDSKEEALEKAVAYIESKVNGSD